jgi:hypothetical protein
VARMAFILVDDGEFVGALARAREGGLDALR